MAENLIRNKLNEQLSPSILEITDTSSGCGQSYHVLIVSGSFEGLSLLKRHQLVNNILQDELSLLHAFSQKTMTPQEHENTNANN